jgi:hypothetical protein
MKRFLFAAVLMVLVCGVAVGQDFPKVEVFGGYSLLRLGISNSDLDAMVTSIEEAAPAGTIITASSSKLMMKGVNDTTRIALWILPPIWTAQRFPEK